jgi:hypothetical protein
MGAGILPTTIYKGKLFFLFGKENKYEDSAKGFSDFGGGTDNKESYLETAVREGGEELTGFLGTGMELKKMLMKHGTYNIDYNSDKHSTYRMHIFPFKYEPLLPYYYNNNQKFLQKRLDQKVYKESTIFEKAEIKWVCVDDLKQMKPQFRSYFQNIIDMILDKREQIKFFISRGLKKVSKHKTLKKR